MNKHLLNELEFKPTEHPKKGKYYDVYCRFINKDDSFSLELVGLASYETMEDWCVWYNKHKAPWFEFQLRLRDLRILIKQEFSKLFKKEKNK